MPITFTVDPTAHVVAAVVTPPQPTAQEFAAFLDAVLAHPDHRPGFGLIYDRRPVRDAAAAAYIWAAADAIRSRADRLGRPRWAILVADPAVYGVARMSGLLTDPHADIAPFFDERDARQWLAGEVRMVCGYG